MGTLKKILFYSFASLISIGVVLLVILSFAVSSHIIVSIHNSTGGKICLAKARLGVVNDLEDIHFPQGQFTSLSAWPIFSDKLSISYYPGECRDDANPINRFCTLPKEGEWESHCEVVIGNDRLYCQDC